MYIKLLKITNFRNFNELETYLAPGVNIFFGQNGSGKTNILEALFVLCLGRSHRGASETVMINTNSDFYRVEGHVFAQEREHEVAIACGQGGRKRVSLDKVSIRLSELYETLCAVSAGPEDSTIISGSPSARRNFVDIYLSQFSNRYLRDLTDYQKVLAQKNAALKNDMDTSPFDELLVSYGAAVMLARGEFLNSVQHLATRYYTDISHGAVFKMEYSPSVTIEPDALDMDDIKTAFTNRLRQKMDRERAMRVALVGPHRDDITFVINGMPARTHGSQGEWRTAAVSLKLAVYHLLKEKRKTEPILLLDEIFAELDEERAEALIESFGSFGQVFLTTAVKPPETLRQSSRSYRVEAGTIAGVE